jgi:hypothetical protein
LQRDPTAHPPCGVIEDPDLHDEAFGRRLRAERERRLISLESIAANTNVNIALCRGLERDDVSAWPSGIFRRSFFRSYAQAIGVDVEENLREFLQRFPDPYHAEPKGSEASPAGGSQKPAPAGALRLTLAETSRPFTGGRLVRRLHRRVAAAAMDLGVTLAIALAAYLVVGDFWSPLAVAAVAYYVGGVLWLGNTPGVCLLGFQTVQPAAEQPPVVGLTLVHRRDLPDAGDHPARPAADAREAVAGAAWGSRRGR